jgi:protein SFI1
MKAWQRRFLSGGWRKWRTHVDSSRVALRLARHNHKLATAVGNRDAARFGWTEWRKYTVEYRRLANLMSKAYAKQQRLYKQSVWNKWREFQVGLALLTLFCSKNTS